MADPLCVMFAGQSVQECGMGRELWKLKPAREILERLKPALGADLEFVTTQMPDPELARTFNAQRAIHAHHLGHWFAYKALHPATTLNGAIGHSMGVVAALVAAEALSVEDSGVFIRARAQAFSDVCKSFTAPMGLAAISTDEFADVIDELAAFPGVTVALHNTISRGVLGGTIADLEAFSAAAQEQDWPVKIKILKVEGPYHTRVFAPARPPLESALAKIELKKPRVPVFMGTSGKLEDDPARIRTLLVDQADGRERHLEAVQAAYAHGCRAFLEAAHKPQPVTWLGDQLQDEAGAPNTSVTGLAVKTEDLSR